jgi:hypothetical protein
MARGALELVFARAHARRSATTNKEGDNMNKMLISLFFGALVAIGGTALAASGAADPVMGTWKLNVAKSTTASGPATGSESRTYSQGKDGITVVINSVAADGKATSSKTIYHLDGKAYPVTGNADFDSISGKQTDANTADFSMTRAGKAVGTLRRAVSMDGKTLTVTTDLTDAKGMKMKSTNSYDKQ